MNKVLTDAEYISCLHPLEERYYKISMTIAIIFWVILTLGTFGLGLMYVWLVGLSIVIGHAIFLAHIRGYGLKIWPKQFPEMYEIAKNTGIKLGLDRMPDIYIYNMDGLFNAFATHFFSRNFVIITTAILDACDGDAKKIEFIIAHEMTHLQRNHTRNQFTLAPSRLIPWLGSAYSRACENTCDGVAGKFIMNDKNEAIRWALLLPTADKTRANHVDIDAYEEQRKESTWFWMTLVEIKASHPFSFNRVAFLRKIFGEEIAPVPRSAFGILIAPFFSVQALVFIYILLIFVFIGNSISSYKNWAWIQKNATHNEDVSRYGDESWGDAGEIDYRLPSSRE